MKRLSVMLILTVLLGAAAIAAEGERPGWYVRKATARESYDASLRKKSETAAVSYGPWHYAGPFANENGQGFTTEFPPEKGVDLKAVYQGLDGAEVRWRREDKFKDGQVNSLAIFPQNDNFTVYLYRVIKAEAATKLPAVFGSDDTLNVWLNGKQLLAVRASRHCILGDEKATLPLRAGENQLLIKITQGNGPSGFAFGVGASDSSGDEELFQALAQDFPREAGALRTTILLEADYAAQYAELEKDLQNKGWFNGVAKFAYRPEALIGNDDSDPLGVTLRRTAALLAELKATAAAAKLAPLEREFKALADRIAAAEANDADARRKLYREIRGLQRRLAFSNPLLDFDKIVFVKRHFLPPHEQQGNHMCDQYFGFHAIRGGGVFVLERPFGDAPECRDILADATCGDGRFAGRRLDSDSGSFLSPTLSYDAKTVLFAYTEADRTLYKWTEKSTWHLFKVGIDGAGLTQLTDGVVNDFDPCYLPNGRVVFISERRGGFGRCHGRPVPTFTLFSMEDDGSDITCISYHETNEWHPSVNNEGMLVYTRWDYVDRGHGQAHHPWITTPDGRDARAIQGNYGRARPNMEMQVRAIPNSRKYVATATAHHGQAYGSLVILDPKVPDDDAMAAVKMLTPEVGFPESSPGNWRREVYASAWPLSEKFFLCVYDPQGDRQRGPKNRFGIYLVDAFGNRELIYRDADISCLDPIPGKVRQAPPVIPHRTAVGAPRIAGAPKPPAPDVPATGIVGVMNVYDSLKAWPEGTKITALRIVQALPKTTPHADNPRIGFGQQKNARKVLGTVPVEDDGSAHFELPAGKPVFFQALDANGLAVQSMRSDTYVHPGETLMCQGCHQPTPHTVAAPKQYPLAMRREPSKIAPETAGSNPFSYPLLVQPVLDRHCVDCHAKEPKAMDLSKGDWEKNHSHWYTSYQNLESFAFFFKDAAWTVPRTTPGQFGARASKLYALLDKGHYDVKLPPADLHRITLWLDCNSDFFGAYDQTREQAAGQVVVPALE